MKKKKVSLFLVDSCLNRITDICDKKVPASYDKGKTFMDINATLVANSDSEAKYLMVGICKSMYGFVVSEKYNKDVILISSTKIPNKCKIFIHLSICSLALISDRLLWKQKK